MIIMGLLIAEPVFFMPFSVMPDVISFYHITGQTVKVIWEVISENGKKTRMVSEEEIYYDQTSRKKCKNSCGDYSIFCTFFFMYASVL